MRYSEKSFEERFKTMGDAAEQAFRTWAESKGIAAIPFGFNRPPFNKFYKVPFYLRMMPDFICEGDRHFFVECKGTGGRAVKIKFESLEGLELWNEELTVWVFIYDSNNHRVAFVSLRALEEICHGCKTYSFNDGKKYYNVPTSKFTWEDVKENTNE